MDSNKSELSDAAKKKSASLSQKKKKKINWIIITVLLSFFITVFLTYISSIAFQDVGVLLAFIVLLLFIFLGIIFDVIGVAVTSAGEKSFHSMSAKRVFGAREALWLIKNVDRVANFCNDVIGDICGIISGATCAIIITKLIQNPSFDNIITNLVLTGIVSSITVGGKAMGKSVGINKDREVVFFVGKILRFFKLFGRGDKQI